MLILTRGGGEGFGEGGVGEEQRAYLIGSPRDRRYSRIFILLIATTRSLSDRFTLITADLSARYRLQPVCKAEG